METQEVLRLVQDVTARVITPRFRALADGEVSEKNPGDLVTVADQEAEALLTEALHAAYPEAVILGEEAYAADPGLLDRFAAADHAFTLDPLDGTKNFVAGSPDHAVMIAEVRAGEAVRSWIWQPQHRLAYVAERGSGARRNGHLLHRERAARVARALTSEPAWVGRRLGDLPPLELTWVCSGVDYPRLAEGAADLALYVRADPWDHLPGALLLVEAGGWCGDASGRPLCATSAVRAPSGGPAAIAAADHATYERVLTLQHSLTRSR